MRAALWLPARGSGASFSSRPGLRDPRATTSRTERHRQTVGEVRRLGRRRVAEPALRMEREAGDHGLTEQYVVAGLHVGVDVGRDRAVALARGAAGVLRR